MKNDLTENELELLEKADLLLSYLRIDYNLAMLSLKKITDFYSEFWELFTKAGELGKAEECAQNLAKFNTPEHYIKIVEDVLNNEDRLPIPKVQLIPIYFNMMEASMAANDFERLTLYKKKIDELLMEDDSNENIE